MDQKAVIKTLELLETRTEKIQNDIVQVKLDIAANKEVSELKARMAAMEVKMYIVYTVVALIVSGVVGFAFKNN